MLLLSLMMFRLRRRQRCYMPHAYELDADAALRLTPPPALLPHFRHYVCYAADITPCFRYDTLSPCFDAAIHADFAADSLIDAISTDDCCRRAAMLF